MIENTLGTLDLDVPPLRKRKYSDAGPPKPQRQLSVSYL